MKLGETQFLPYSMFMDPVAIREEIPDNWLLQVTCTISEGITIEEDGALIDFDGRFPRRMHTLCLFLNMELPKITITKNVDDKDLPEHQDRKFDFWVEVDYGQGGEPAPEYLAGLKHGESISYHWDPRDFEGAEAPPEIIIREDVPEGWAGFPM